MCDCLVKVNAVLAERHTALDLPIVGVKRPYLATRWTGTAPRRWWRALPAKVQATCCPFCGAPYDESLFDHLFNNIKDGVFDDEN